ncbi:MAG: hypothetical protein LAO03_17490 [Acidobacteriia bacterium]|nr:hypothetical protein [Terriglobia bacterium]
MKLSSLFLGALFAVAVLAVLLLVVGGEFYRPVQGQGAALYNPANEVVVKGVVEQVTEFTCPVSEGELGTHLMVKTSDGMMQIHLVQARILRSQQVKFNSGDQVEVVGAKLHYRGHDDLIAREITRGNETLVFRDHAGKLLMTQP